VEAKRKYKEHNDRFLDPSVEPSVVIRICCQLNSANKVFYKTPFIDCMRSERYFDATTPRRAVTLPGPSLSMGPKNSIALPTPLGSLHSPQVPPRRPPLRISGDRVSRYREARNTALGHSNVDF
jgi:hypothetical protein